MNGASGLVGLAIVRLLTDRNHSVAIFDVRPPRADLLPAASPIDVFIGDITSIDDLTKAMQSVDVVIHTASPPHGLDSQVYYKVNVTGTQNVIDACVTMNVAKLVFTSSASVVFNGSDIIGGDEDLPYCETHMDAYNDSKVDTLRIRWTMILMN